MIYLATRRILINLSSATRASLVMTMLVEHRIFGLIVRHVDALRRVCALVFICAITMTDSAVDPANCTCLGQQNQGTRTICLIFGQF